MKYLLIPILIVSSFGLASCSVDLNSKSPSTNYLDRVTASSNSIVQKRTISAFEGLDVSSAIAVTVDDANYDDEITVEAPDNIMDRITTQVENGILVIKIKGTVNLKDASIKVKFPHRKLRSFAVSGASSVNVLPTLKVEKINIDLSGASNLKLDVISNQILVDNSGASSMKISGNTQNLKISVSGASSLIAKEMKAANVIIDCSGASSSTVWAIDTLKANSSGASSVKYIEQSGLKTTIETSGMASVKSIK